MRILVILGLTLGVILQIALAEPVINPIRAVNGSDPWITYNKDDQYYYFLTTTFTNVQITRAKTINGLKTGERRVVYEDNHADRCCNIWAPELHRVDGTWHIYFTAGKAVDLDFQRLHVISGGRSPWGNYTYVRQISPDWGIDGTVATVKGRRIFYFSCQHKGLQSLCGADLVSPTRIGPKRWIVSPTLPWEKNGNVIVNEGPVHLAHGGKDYLVYSASYCWTASYTLGLLTLQDGGDPLDPQAWIKSGPLTHSTQGHYGPGHNGFFKSPDGKETWIVYHATTNPNGACDGTRHTMVGRVNFTNNGPAFPLPATSNISIPGPSGEP